MRDVCLEPARVVDAPRIAAMSRELIENGLRPSWATARVARHIWHPESVVLKATAAGQIAGFAIMHFGDEIAHLNLLAVSPSHRRHGIARKLMAWLEETAFTAGTFEIALELRSTNAAAHAFYAALGYREIGRVRGYYEGTEDAIRMTRDVRRIPGEASRLPRVLLELFAPAHKGRTHRTSD